MADPGRAAYLGTLAAVGTGRLMGAQVRRSVHPTRAVSCITSIAEALAEQLVHSRAVFVDGELCLDSLSIVVVA
jgi:hypothetical protein